MKKLKFAVLMFGLFSGELYADCSAKETVRVINSSAVNSISTCWSGSNVIVAKMVNGERIVLGAPDDALAKIRLSQVMQAQAAGLPVSYSRSPSSVTVCVGEAYTLEWLTVGKSDCSGVWN